MNKVLRCRTKIGPITKNIGTMLIERRRLFGDRPVYREKKDGDYRTLTWNELYAKVELVGESLIRLGLKPGQVVSLYSRNREEMLVMELATMAVGAVSNPIFSEYPTAQLDYIIAHSGSRTLLVSDEPHLEIVLSAPSSKKLDRIFVIDSFKPRPGGKIVPFDSLYLKGTQRKGAKSFASRIRAVAPKSPCLLMYTSGTTGNPKGALLCHRNILSQRRAIDLMWKLKPGGRFLSYLPWHHSFGGIFELFGALYSGACLTLDESYGRNLPLLIENFKRVKPTIYFSVPRIYQALVEAAKASPEAEREIFHPELKFVFTAAAAMPRHISDYLESRNIGIVEGWGLTETSPCVTMTRITAKRRSNNVGLPIPGVSVKLASDGEILVRGPNVMLGYHKDPKRNALVIDKSGWFHTGDFGAISAHGLTLTCRKDGMFKLTTGQMVITEIVENALAASPLVQHSVAVGGGKDFVAAIVFPNIPALKSLGERLGIAKSENLLEDPVIHKHLREEIAKASLAVPEKYARPKAIALVGEMPSLANGELTPTMKLVKPKVFENHAATIAAIFRPDVASAAAKAVIRI